MKKVHLYAASAMLAVLLSSGFAQAADMAPAAATGPMVGMMAQQKALPEDKAKMLQDAIAKVHEANKPLFEKVGALHKELNEILTAESFDKDAYIAKQAEIHEAMGKIGQARAEALADVAAKFTPEERAVLSHPMMGMRSGPMMMNGQGPMDGKRPMMMRRAAKKAAAEKAAAEKAASDAAK